MASWPAALADAVLSTGLSPISSSTTSLPRLLSERATASTVNAVSTLRFLAKVLRVTAKRPDPFLRETGISGRTVLYARRVGTGEGILFIGVGALQGS